MKDIILTLLVAGHDTTTAALTWLMKFLGENPNVLERLREEHRQIRESGKGGESLSWSEVNNMPYTLKGTRFRKVGRCWSLNVDVSIHNNPEYFPQPKEFDPSRFDEPMKPFGFLGFGNRPRMCPGINLAKLEICIFIHHLVCKYKWTPPEKDDSVQPTLVRMPKNKYPVLVEPV